MGVCLSGLGKSESRKDTGVNSKYVRTNENDLGNTNVPSTTTRPTPTSEGEILHCSKLKSFSFSELKTATRNFHRNNLLGEGDFGSVFKGWVNENSLVAAKPGTGVVIAVKRLYQHGLEGDSEWLAEVNYLGQFSHSHLVRLIGYCLKDKHRLLVFEYMSRGSLENHLFRQLQCKTFGFRAGKGWIQIRKH
ncbi:putative serine/threonine-protein kinase pbl9 [Stylosanthes scabra]|uniref:Serine/threonine-protein kinase pbl9 n=1 Tax=Stylosanthes scabra TaxID=79078 RepID=A0ABU6YQ79_9FABA|nr:putative serine/threonine-protein kinase pbl9 [Stylosanthes scabra]